MSLRIVTHCYAAEKPFYAAFLRYQLSSLILYPPKTQVVVEVCCTPDDRNTRDVLDWFICHACEVWIRPSWMIPQEKLFRRAIGRNQAAMSCHEELIWFCDVDHAFGEGCVDGLWAEWEKQANFVSMIYPKQIMIHKDHATGDSYAAASFRGGVLDVNPDDFVPMRYSKAIGGVQVVPGSLARKHGYLDGHRRYQKPLDRPFANFHDDVAFRKSCSKHGPIVPVDVPNLFRLRHTEVTYRGKVPA